MIHYTANGENTIISNSCNNFEHFYQLNRRPNRPIPFPITLPIPNEPPIALAITQYR